MTLKNVNKKLAFAFLKSMRFKREINIPIQITAGNFSIFNETPLVHFIIKRNK